MSDAPEDPKDAKPRKVGFGAFSQKYRDRWAADHPDQPAQPAPDAATDPATPGADAPPPAPPTKP